MKLKGLIDEDFVNYKLPSMFLIFPHCTFKCDKENGCALCQNSALAQEADIVIKKEEIIERYLFNPITSAIVCGGLEPMDDIIDLLAFIESLRNKYNCKDIVVIYTGYTEEEIMSGKFGTLAPNLQKGYITELLNLGNIVIKYGRFRSNQEKHHDAVLGVDLVSNNQYAKEYL